MDPLISSAEESPRDKYMLNHIYDIFVSHALRIYIYLRHARGVSFHKDLSRERQRVANDRRKKSSKRSINTLRGVSSDTNNIATNDSGKRNQERERERKKR